ncbi:nuclease-related domain-containing protein [Mycoplasma sp. CB776]
MNQEQISVIAGISVSMFLMLLITFFLLFLRFKYFKKMSKQEQLGLEAEKNINFLLRKWAEKNNFYFLESSLYKYNDNQLFEVDGILLTNKAIIIVEIKSINGVIKGNSTEKTLNKVLGNKSFEISNPIYQNDKHIYHIKKMLDGNFPILSLIVFSNRAQRLEIENELAYVIICLEDELNQILFDINTSLEERINPETLKAIKEAFEKYQTNNKKDYLVLKSFSTSR